MNKTLNIVSFNVPYPPDYGGVIDVYYKIRALKESGCNIILHCFKYGREEASILNSLCAEVHYYSRPKNLTALLYNLPFIVITRNSKQLVKNLSQNNCPILFEGLHSTYFLHRNGSTERKTIVRTHNIEHQYYYGLARTEKNILKKLYYRSEARKLKRYEKILEKADNIAAISEADSGYFENKYGKTVFIPAFHPSPHISIKEGRGEYILFHADLTVPDNIKSCLFLIDNVFKNLKYPVIIAGKNPDKQVEAACRRNNLISLIKNPGETEMENLITNAQINILYTFLDTGLKLKLLYSLYRGRFCVANSLLVNNTGLGSLCFIADTPPELKLDITRLFNQDFDSDEIRRRKTILDKHYDTGKNAEKLVEIIFGK